MYPLDLREGQQLHLDPGYFMEPYEFSEEVLNVGKKASSKNQEGILSGRV